MSLTLAEYVAKYPIFESVDLGTYNQAIADATTELSLHEWSSLYDRAEQMLIGHFLFLQNPARYQSVATMSSVKVDTQGYQTQTDANLDAFSGNSFGKEYKRLLGLISQDRSSVRAPSFGVSLIVQRPAPVEVEW